MLPTGVCVPDFLIDAFLYFRYILIDTAPGATALEVRRKRLTLDVDPQFQRRLKARAALQGISMREYCLAAIEKQLTQDEQEAGRSLGLRRSHLDAKGSS